MPQDSKNTLPPTSRKAKLKMLLAGTIPDSLLFLQNYSRSHPGSTSANSQQSTRKMPSFLSPFRGRKQQQEAQ